MSGISRKKNLVAVTGIGMICPLGITTGECWDNMLAGKSGVRRITRFDASECLTKIAGELPDKYFEMEKNALPRRVYKRSILPTRLAIISAKQALEDGEIVYVNDNLAEMVGYDKEELTGQLSPDFYYDRDDRKKVLEILQRDGRVSNLEIRLKKKDGSIIWTTFSLTTLEGAGA